MTEMGKCLMTNCRKQTAKGEAMCAEHKFPPGILRTKDLIRAAAK